VSSFALTRAGLKKRFIVTLSEARHFAVASEARAFGPASE